MMKSFDYDLVTLLGLIKERPCLWDRNLDNYKDKTERRACWEEICTIVDDGFGDKSFEERKCIEEQIISKWTNVRDTFMKSLRPRMGRAKRKYILHDHLTFLLKNKTEDSSFNIEEQLFKEESSEALPLPAKRKKNNVPAKTSMSTSSEECDTFCDSAANFVECSQPDDRIMNEDEAFFASLLPTVVKYSLQERLEFRMDVLGVMKKINDKRNERRHI